MRQEFELTQAQFDRILAASQPVPYIVFGGREPPSPQENAERAWQEVASEAGFQWLTVKPHPSKGKMFITAEPATPAQLALITPCPVCNSIEECPHTPVRCQHDWRYGDDASRPAAVRAIDPQQGDLRTCAHCGREERAVMNWDTVKA